MSDQRDEADAADDLPDRPTQPGDAQVPEADALEQAAELSAPPEEPETVGDAPEADALEQGRGVADDDDDRR